MFIEIDNEMFINLDNVTNIFESDTNRIRICFEHGYTEIKRENEEELNKVWEWLRENVLKG